MKQLRYINALRMIGMIILGGFLFFVVSYFFIPPIYKSYTVFRVEPMEDYISYNFLSNEQPIKKYNDIIHQAALEEKVLENLQISFSSHTFRNKVKVERVGETNLMSVVVKDTIPERARDLSNETTEILQKELPSTLKDHSVEILEEASSPVFSRFSRTLWSILLGGLVGMVGASILNGLQNRKKVYFSSKEELCQAFDYPVIAEIPFITEKTLTARKQNELFMESLPDENTQK